MLSDKQIRIAYCHIDNDKGSNSEKATEKSNKWDIGKDAHCKSQLLQDMNFVLFIIIYVPSILNHEVLNFITSFQLILMC